MEGNERKRKGENGEWEECKEKHKCIDRVGKKYNMQRRQRGKRAYHIIMNGQSKINMLIDY